MKNVPALVLLLIVPAAAAAQANTADMLAQAIRLHANLDVERELPLLRQIIQPNSPFEVTRDQRVIAYKYLGAALAVQGRTDSAVIYFRAAIERDPFTDLDPQRFSPREVQAFALARRQTFAMAVRPVVADTVNPRTERVNFTVLSTHGTDLRVELRPTQGAGGVRLYSGENDGPRDLQWDGLLADGRLAPPGRYVLVVAGQSRLTQRTDTVRMVFTLDHDHPALEDTLAALPPADLLPEQYPASAARGELLKGFAVGGAAVLIPTVLANGQLDGGGRRLAIGLAGAASVTGFVAFLHRQRHRGIPANIAQNQQRRAERATANAAITRRNSEKLALTKLVIQ